MPPPKEKFVHIVKVEVRHVPMLSKKQIGPCQHFYQIGDKIGTGPSDPNGFEIGQIAIVYLRDDLFEIRLYDTAGFCKMHGPDDPNRPAKKPINTFKKRKRNKKV